MTPLLSAILSTRGQDLSVRVISDSLLRSVQRVDVGKRGGGGVVEGEGNLINGTVSHFYTAFTDL